MKTITYEQYKEMRSRDDVGAKWFLMNFKEEYPTLNNYYESLDRKQERVGNTDNKR